MQKTLTMTRTFDTPKDNLYKYWSDPDYMKTWWWPAWFTCPECQMDFKVWWKYLNCMRSPEWQNFWSTGIYKEIIPGNKIVFTDNFSDEKGNVVSASYYGMWGDWPEEITVTLTLEEQNDKTIMTLMHDWIPLEMHEDCKTWWNQSFDKLEKILSNNQ